MKYIEFLGRAEEGMQERDLRGFSERRVSGKFGLQPKVSHDFSLESSLTWLCAGLRYLSHQAWSLIDKRHAHPYF